VATGNGGLTGYLAYGTMAYTVGLGFSAVGINNSYHTVYNGSVTAPGTMGPANWACVDAVNLGDIRTWSGDLSAARDRGAKILHYHGLQDPVGSCRTASRRATTTTSPRP
jgi:feruloyl esterase